MKEKISIKTSERLFYLILLILCVLPEIIYIGGLGFYWDDWSQLFLHTKFGDAAFPDYYAYNRPLSAWTDMLFFPVCGSSPLKWHLLLLLLKYILCVLFYKISNLVIPHQKKLSETASLLFAVCPLFSQSYISIAYTQHFTDFILFALSVLLLLRSVSEPRKSLKTTCFLLSVICTILHLTVTEYFAFLELIKIPLLWSVVRKEKNSVSCLNSITKYYAPHFVIFILYCLYRLNITKFFPFAGTETPDLLYLFMKSPAAGIRSFLKNLSVDMLYPFTHFLSGLFAFNIQSILTATELLMITISLITACFVFFFLTKIRIEQQDLIRSDKDKVLENGSPVPASGRKPEILFILICFAGIFLGVLPFLIMNENALNTDDPAHADRTFLAALPFVCIVFSLLLKKFFPNRKLYAAAAGLTVFLFCHGQMNAYLKAKQFTDEQNSFYQQLSIRIPGIMDGTAIVDDTIIFPDQGNFATASALNVLYPNPIRENGDVPVWVFSYPERLRENHGLFNVKNRIYHFKQPAADYIYIDHDNRYANCVWVFTPEDTDNPHISDLQRGWIEGTSIDRIEPGKSFTPDDKIFGHSENNWCNYYQQASLLLQKEEWDKLSELTDTVLKEGFSPSDNRSNSPFEWWPFIAGLLHNGKQEEAKSLADEAVMTDNAYGSFFAERFSSFH